MHETAQHLHIPPFGKELPSPIAFRSANMPAHATYPQHSHAWGEFVYAFSGVMEIKLGDRHLLAPPQYGVWLAPNLEHRGLNPLLLELEANPGDTRSLAELASLVHTTERTLMRRCRRELGMSLAQWRKRLRVVSSMGHDASHAAELHKVASRP